MKQTDQFQRYGKTFRTHLQAKRITRKYHGQGLSERTFMKQLYTSKFNVVTGGSGTNRLLWGGFYQMVERRLDTVIFRSLFATSIQQARQMVRHGHVEVNGRKVF
jgi:ribosomal protein S4